MESNRIVICFDPNPDAAFALDDRVSEVWLVSSDANKALAGTLRGRGANVTLFHLDEPSVRSIAEVLEEVRVHHPTIGERTFVFPNENKHVFEAAIASWNLE